MATIPLPLPKGYQRLDSFPIDSTDVFTTLALLENYALTNASAYAGQLCTVTATDKLYIILSDKTVREIPRADQLPSYVDDIVEAENFAALPTPGETGKIYVTLNDNKIYRWSGTQFTEVSPNVVPAITDINGLQTSLDSKALKTIYADTILSGTVNPAAADGTNGQFYLNTTTDTIFGPKAGGLWPAGIAAAGQRWVKTDTMRAYERYNSAWVEVGSNDALFYSIALGG